MLSFVLHFSTFWLNAIFRVGSRPKSKAWSLQFVIILLSVDVYDVSGIFRLSSLLVFSTFCLDTKGGAKKSRLTRRLRPFSRPTHSTTLLLGLIITIAWSFYAYPSKARLQWDWKVDKAAGGSYSRRCSSPGFHYSLERLKTTAS